MLCVLWWASGGSEAALASSVSIGSFVLTQMVLSQQRRRELALQLKIDELILAKRGARDEIAGIERKTEDEIEELRARRDLTDEIGTTGSVAVEGRSTLALPVCMAAASRFWRFWIRKTIRNVTIIVAVFTTNCHASE